MRGYGYVTVASGAVYLQRESVLENTRILTSRKHTRRQKREWKKDPMLASRYSLQTLRQPKFSCKVLRSSSLSPYLHINLLYQAYQSHPSLTAWLITGAWLSQAILIRKDISMESLQNEAHSFTCLISPVFLGQGSVMQVVSTTQGLGYLMKHY